MVRNKTINILTWYHIRLNLLWSLHCRLLGTAQSCSCCCRCAWFHYRRLTIVPVSCNQSWCTGLIDSDLYLNTRVSKSLLDRKRALVCRPQRCSLAFLQKDVRRLLRWWRPVGGYLPMVGRLSGWMGGIQAQGVDQLRDVRRLWIAVAYQISRELQACSKNNLGRWRPQIWLISSMPSQ